MNKEKSKLQLLNVYLLFLIENMDMNTQSEKLKLFKY